MKLSEELQWRGFVAEHTLDQISDLDKAPRNFYWGTDPSADSLHIGHLAALMMCACFVRHGYTPYYLVGGATGQIGDPKETAERDLKSLDEIAANKAALAKQIVRVTHSPEDTKVLDNLDWFGEVKFLPFLREIGKAFSMTQLLDRQFVQARIGEGGSGISYAEFSYTLIQGYDFLHLFREHNIDLQLCGADQYGNCTSGIHLIKRLENAKADAYSCPLIIDKVTGRKFGKSEGNAVWLDSNKTSIFDFYQFWLNQADDTLEEFFKYYTLITPEELDKILAKHRENPGARYGQRKLAAMVTEIVHGADAAKSAEKITAILFGDGKLSDLSADELDLLAKSFPTAKTGAQLLDILVETGLASSKGEGRKLLAGNAISINGEKVTDDQTVSETALIKRGKNKFALVR
ncbi:tyrosine--tRNA ligase [Candidatus Saccharibacteria bacterium]|nr:tyrosine--tRNA ligase [Candidatus Saccharibacteria bacterium]MBR3378416.1 tyrosine--tRNA ligase [Candidatus Saccharibacteria bacterium]